MMELTRQMKTEEARRSRETRHVPIELQRQKWEQNKSDPIKKKKHSRIFRDSLPAHLPPFCHVIVISLPQSGKAQGHFHFPQRDR